MIKIDDISSLLEIMFAVNAVIIALNNKYKTNQKYIYDFVFDALMKNGAKQIKRSNHYYLKRASYKLFPKVKKYNDNLYYFSIAISAFGLLTPLFILIATNINDSFSQISKAMFIFIIAAFIFISPSVYFIYNRTTSYLIDRIKFQNFDLIKDGQFNERILELIQQEKGLENLEILVGRHQAAVLESKIRRWKASLKLLKRKFNHKNKAQLI